MRDLKSRLYYYSIVKEQNYLDGLASNCNLTAIVIHYIVVVISIDMYHMFLYNKGNLISIFYYIILNTSKVTMRGQMRSRT